MIGLHVFFGNGKKVFMNALDLNGKNVVKVRYKLLIKQFVLSLKKSWLQTQSPFELNSMIPY